MAVPKACPPPSSLGGDSLEYWDFDLVHSCFSRRYSSWLVHLFQYPSNISEASSFSRRFSSASSPKHFTSCVPSLSYFRPPFWLAYHLALVVPIWMNLRVISAPTKSPRSQYDSKISQRAEEEFVAKGTARKAQYCRMRLLYGSKLGTPISPRAMACEKLRSSPPTAGASSGGFGATRSPLALLGILCVGMKEDYGHSNRRKIK
jgi:hypothetical protein